MENDKLACNEAGSADALASPGRRRLGKLALGGVIAAVGWPLILTPGKARASEKLVVANWGGITAKKKQAMIYDPFTKETGIPVIQVYGPELAKMKAQVQAKAVEWDVIDLIIPWVAAGEQAGLFEEIDYSVIPKDRMLPSAVRKFEIATHFYSGGIAASTSRIPKERRPQTWAQFWDVKNFPGRRGLRQRIGETLELALLADGVPADKVYPCDVERAFRSLDKIKPHIKQWIVQTPQTISLIESNELDFSYTYNSRVYDIQKDHIPISFSLENNLIGANWVSVTKGTRHKAAAMRFLEFFTRPDRQLAYCNTTSHAPVTKGTLEKMDPAVRPYAPDVLNKSNLVLSADWWAGKDQELELRFKEWLMT